jgi:hypothetical protein
MYRAGDDHVAVAHAVDQLALVAVDAGDDLRRHDPGLEPILAAHAHLRGDRVDGGLDLALVALVQLEHAVGALDDLHAGAARGGLERRVGELVDRDAGRDLDERGGLVLLGHEARAHRLQEAGELRLE